VVAAYAIDAADVQTFAQRNALQPFGTKIIVGCLSA
jgi:hypothetical protein